jgi:hypothetical protein
MCPLTREWRFCVSDPASPNVIPLANCSEGIADLRFSKTVMVRAYDFTDGAFLIVVFFGCVIETNGKSEFRLKDIGVHHHIGALCPSLADGNDLMGCVPVLFFAGIPTTSLTCK